MARTAISTALVTIAVVALVLGRYETLHMTEGEALINGWAYWLTTLVCGSVGAWLCPK